MKKLHWKMRRKQFFCKAPQQSRWKPRLRLGPRPEPISQNYPGTPRTTFHWKYQVSKMFEMVHKEQVFKRSDYFCLAVRGTRATDEPLASFHAASICENWTFGLVRYSWNIKRWFLNNIQMPNLGLRKMNWQKLAFVHCLGNAAALEGRAAMNWSVQAACMCCGRPTLARRSDVFLINWRILNVAGTLLRFAIWAKYSSVNWNSVYPSFKCFKATMKRDWIVASLARILPGFKMGNDDWCPRRLICERCSEMRYVLPDPSKGLNLREWVRFIMSRMRAESIDHNFDGLGPTNWHSYNKYTVLLTYAEKGHFIGMI